MGKGKGERVGVYVRVYAGAVLVAFSALRLSLLKLVQRRYQVRTYIPLGRSIPGDHGPQHPSTCFVGQIPVGGLSFRILQRRWLTQQVTELSTFVKQLDRPNLSRY